jgi:ribonuclease Z
MRVTLLGTGPPFPNAQRFGSAILVEVGGKRLLFDCSRGVVIRLVQTGVSPKDIDALFLTHDHGTVKPAFGYRVDSAGHSVVISGDTKFSQNLIDFARGADCLIHVAWSFGWKNPTPPSQRLLPSAEDAGRVFARVRPKLGVIYHYKDEAELSDAVRKQYNALFVVAKDLMVINIGNTVTWQREGFSGSSATDEDKFGR